MTTDQGGLRHTPAGVDVDDPTNEHTQPDGIGENETLLALRHISKAFPGVTALSDVNLDVVRGEVHALVGENGAGKSTLIKTLSGALRPTSGTIRIDGVDHESLTPAQARDLGIAVIYQEFTLIPVLSVAENIFLGRYPMKGAVLDRKAMAAESDELFARLGIHIDSKTLVQDLTTGYQQLVEIAKALSQDARLLIMDEPSAPLMTAEVEALFHVVETLRQQGVTIIYISHRLEEIFRISDRVSVLRDGAHVATLRTRDTDKNELIKLMVGRELSESYPARTTPPGEVYLSVTDVSGNGVKDITFEARRGEVLGFAGLIGAGRTELMQLLFGAEPIESGSISLGGRPITAKSPIAAVTDGIALVPEDRKRHGVILNLSIRDNVSLPMLKRISLASVIRAGQERALVDEYMNALQIKAPSTAQKVMNLSGGNQQKVVLAKWLATSPEVLIFDEPTRGIDVGAKQEIYSIMNDLAAQGKVIIMISSDMEELIGMSDRVIVLHRGRLAGTLNKSEIVQEKILALSSGELEL